MLETRNENIFSALAVGFLILALFLFSLQLLPVADLAKEFGSQLVSLQL
ncbi:hypothetical protein ERICV_02889 [Paenibacillus larvae subsp. larvae]|uniref:Uncharacterized protein n=1 Tax=Paenibacillus larvae subsp. larvae TaxID=147375 RepID=A0A6C0QUF4_9BACL|nr:hypothetical protein ERICV_02889 [Paenibacillus larvae subsp. larvae]